MILSICLSACLPVCFCLSPKRIHKNAIFSKAKQFKAMISIDEKYIGSGLLKGPVLGPLKFKMADDCHNENRFSP